MNIFLLEDDTLLSEIIEEFLISKGYKVTKAYDGESAEDLLYANKYDLLLLDVNVPQVNGFEILKGLREVGTNTPAIFITSLNEISDMQDGFDAGCDDYIKKPFELSELELRINNIKRLYHIEEGNKIELNPGVFLDTINLSLIIDEKTISIRKKEVEIISYMYQNRDKPVSIDELSYNIWSYENSPSPATIRTYIKNIRKVLGADSITNIKGVGYRLN